MEYRIEWKSEEEQAVFARLTEAEQRQMVEYSTQLLADGQSADDGFIFSAVF